MNTQKKKLYCYLIIYVDFILFFKKKTILVPLFKRCSVEFEIMKLLHFTERVPLKFN